LGDRPVIKQLHLGSDTPTFVSIENLNLLLDGIFRIAARVEMLNSILKEIQITPQKST